MPNQKCNTSLSLQQTLDIEKPLVVVGAVNAYCAMLARDAGFKALYLSGAGVANASYGIPDLGLTSLKHILEDTSRITHCVDIPLIVDADTGFDDASKCCKALIRAGAAAMQIEDQSAAKRCGHRDGKKIVSAQNMVDRIKSAVDGRTNERFSIIARTDAYATEGLEHSIERAQVYREAGANIIFAEALRDINDYRRFSAELDIPVLANITEFGKTPLFSVHELEQVGVSIVLFPLTVFRAMSAAATDTYNAIRAEGTQARCLEKLQTRADLYRVLDYLKYEQAQDEDLSN